MLSAVTLLFSSCLGDSEYTPTYGLTGRPLGDLSSSVMLDNGVIATLSGVSATDLMTVDRLFVYGSLAGESAELEQVAPGDKITITPNAIIPMDEMELLTDENPYQDLNLSEIGSLSWYNYIMNINAINGYIYFMITGDCYMKKSESSSSNSNTSWNTVAPNFYINVERVDTNAKIVDLVIGFDNRETECTEDGELKDGYTKQQNTLFALYFNASSLYNQLEGLTDEDTVTYNIYKAEKDNDGEVDKEQISLSFTGIQKGALKRNY